MERKNDKPVKQVIPPNGNSPYFVTMEDELGGTFLSGPYTKDFAEHLQEVFGGQILKEVIEVKNDGKTKTGN